MAHEAARCGDICVSRDIRDAIARTDVVTARKASTAPPRQERLTQARAKRFRPLPDSAVLQAGADCEATDQRGESRDSAACNLGAVEVPFGGSHNPGIAATAVLARTADKNAA